MSEFLKEFIYGVSKQFRPTLVLSLPLSLPLTGGLE